MLCGAAASGGWRSCIWYAVVLLRKGGGATGRRGRCYWPSAGGATRRIWDAASEGQRCYERWSSVLPRKCGGAANSYRRSYKRPPCELQAPTNRAARAYTGAANDRHKSYKQAAIRRPDGRLLRRRSWLTEERHRRAACALCEAMGYWLGTCCKPEASAARSFLPAAGGARSFLPAAGGGRSLRQSCASDRTAPEAEDFSPSSRGCSVLSKRKAGRRWACLPIAARCSSTWWCQSSSSRQPCGTAGSTPWTRSPTTLWRSTSFPAWTPRLTSAIGPLWIRSSSSRRASPRADSGPVGASSVACTQGVLPRRPARC